MEFPDSLRELVCMWRSEEAHEFTSYETLEQGSVGVMTNRRDFLKGAALGLGYSLVVKAPQSLGAQPAPATLLNRDEISARIDDLTPDAVKAGSVADEPNMAKVELECDVFVAGGGLAGICAALSAARNGGKVVLVQDRSRLGGNASSEVRMHPMGSKFGIRETGLIEEFCLDNAYNNEQHSWEMWDLMLYDMCVREANIQLLLDTVLYRAEMKGERIESVWARCDKTELLYHVKAGMYLDCTGDSRLGIECGAEYMVGREPVERFNEPNASYDKPGTTQGSSILFTSRKHDRPVPFKAPSWARVIGARDLEHRRVGPNNWEYGYWWIELGGLYDTIRDNERLRFELLAIVLGVWDYIKNSGDFPEADNWALETVGMIPGKRDSRRLVGDYIMTQADIEGKWKEYEDAVAFGGWPMDDHPAAGFDARDVKPFRPAKYDEAYNIPLGSLYSKNVSNLMMAGRNISASHVAFSTTRVMKTCAVMGQAAGLAALMCVRDKVSPRELRADRTRVKRLQQKLLLDDQSIPGLKNEDENDLARQAKVSAARSTEKSRPENILSGVTREGSGLTDERWAAPMEGGNLWIRLEWDQPVEISQVQLIHDTGLFRTLTMTAVHSIQKKMPAGGQPETIADYVLVGITPDGDEVELAKVTGNYQRMRRHAFEKIRVKALRVDVLRSYGPEARLYEVRVYG